MPSITATCRHYGSRLSDVTPESYHAIFDTNGACWVLCGMIRNRPCCGKAQGSIVNISSSYGNSRWPYLASVCLSAASTPRRHHEICGSDSAGTGVPCQHRLALGPTETVMCNRFAKTKETKLISSSHTVLPSAWEPRRDLQCHRVMGLTRPLTSSSGASLAVDWGMRSVNSARPSDGLLVSNRGGR